MFHHNLSFIDIGIRYIIMMVFMILAGVTHNMIFVYLGVLAFLTAILGWCPMYSMIGFRTRNEE